MLLAVALSATAVTLAGPIGFVGLCAPVLASLLARWVPAFEKHALRLASGGPHRGVPRARRRCRAARRFSAPQAAVDVPTGVATTLLGAIVLVVLARGLRGGSTQPARVRAAARSLAPVLSHDPAPQSSAHRGVAVLGALTGNSWLRTGDIALWLQGTAPPPIALALDERIPRVLAAVCAGAALAVAGGITQSVSRNPLADPGLLGITGGAGLGAVIAVTTGLAEHRRHHCRGDNRSASRVRARLRAELAGRAQRGQACAHRHRGLRGCNRAHDVLPAALGSVEHAGDLHVAVWHHLWSFVRAGACPVLIVLAIALPLVLGARREVDLIALDEDTPRSLGVRLERTRLGLLALAAVLAAASVTAVGVVGFVGLLAPHAARALVGARTARFLPTAAVLGAVLVGIADAVGRTVIAPAQLPAGLMVALLGAPYFVWLLWRTRDA